MTLALIPCFAALFYCFCYNKCIGNLGMVMCFLGATNQFAYMVHYMRSDYYNLKVDEKFQN